MVKILTCVGFVLLEDVDSPAEDDLSLFNFFNDLLVLVEANRILCVALIECGRVHGYNLSSFSLVS